LQRPCAMFLVHFGVNLWTINDELMSAYDLAAANHHTSLARFLDTAATQAFIDDWHAVMKLCRRAAENARRRLSARRQSSVSQRHNVDLHVDDRLYNTSPRPTVNGNVLPDAPSTSSVASFPPSSSMFVQSPRQANGRLFSTPTASDTQNHGHHGRPTDWRRRRRFWPRSAREHGDACEEPFKVASIARQLLLMNVDDDDSLVHDARWRDVREQHRLSSADSCYTTTDASRLTASSSHIDSQFYCQPRVTNKVSDGRTTSDRTQASTEGRSTPASRTTKTMRTTSKTEKAANRRLRQAADVASQTAGDKTSDCSDIYCDPADCIQRHPVMNHSDDALTSLQSNHLLTESGLPQTCVSVNNDDDDDPLRHWLVDNGLAEYWPLLAMEKVDLEALALLTDDDLVHLGVPLGPRRRIQRAVSQLQSSVITATDSSTSNNTYL